MKARYVREQKTSVSTPVVAESGVPFVVGTAPVHSAESPAALFTPVLCTDCDGQRAQSQRAGKKAVCKQSGNEAVQ